jgi:SAM-dependent methyltransferase
MTGTHRQRSFGQDQQPSRIDRLGVWLSKRGIQRHVGSVRGRRVADLGCGYDARLARSMLNDAAHVTVLDVAVAPDLLQHAKVTAIVGDLAARLADVPTASLDVVFCMSVLEHLDDDRSALAEMRRILAPGGTLVVNVPTWLGKAALELSAFRLGTSPREEMDDHKRYYDPRDLWPLLVEAGFLPHGIRCRRHKLGLNTLAVCRLELPSSGEAR